MAINIRDQETLAALREMATITGNPMTAELKAAVDERLARLHERRERRLETLQVIAADAAAHWPGEHRGDPTADLYDRDGLPA